MGKRSPDSAQLPLFDPIVIKLTKGRRAVIDLIDADLAAYKWGAYGDLKRNNAYAAREVKGKMQRLHVIIMERILGRAMLPGEEVDHIDSDTFNNRRDNLRVATRAQNTRNTKLRSNNTSGYKGVSWHKYAWMAQIMFEGKKIYLGLFKTPEEAHEAYCEAAKKYFGEFARFK